MLITTELPAQIRNWIPAWQDTCANDPVVREHLSFVNDIHCKRNAGFFSVRDYPLSFRSQVSDKSIDAFYEEMLDQLREHPLICYIHVPFCEPGCTYCHFYRVGRSTKRLPAEYAQALSGLAYGFSSKIGRLDVHSLYVGGGTPSMLSSQVLSGLLKVFRQHICKTPPKEIAMELDPRHVSEGLLLALLDAGVTRVSLGVQSFDEGELSILGRRHNYAQGHESAALVKKIGLKLSLDIMYGYPGLSPDSLARTLDSVLQISPDQVSAYRLSVHRGTPIARTFETCSLAEAPWVATTQQRIIDRRLTAAGYSAYTAQDYTKGESDIYNACTWQNLNCLGFGPSASSYISGLHWVSHEDIQEFMEHSVNYLPIFRLNRLTHDEQLRRALVLGFKGLQVPVATLKTMHPKEFGAEVDNTLAQMERLGLINNCDGVSHLTTLGRSFFWVVCRAFFSERYADDLKEL